MSRGERNAARLGQVRQAAGARGGSGEGAPEAQPPKGDAFFVSVTKDGGTETHRFDGPSQAQTFVEQLLEEGVPQEEVTAFSGRRMAVRGSHRPIVKPATR